jgi:hypothetical protein
MMEMLLGDDFIHLLDSCADIMEYAMEVAKTRMEARSKTMNNLQKLANTGLKGMFQKAKSRRTSVFIEGTFAEREQEKRTDALGNAAAMHATPDQRHLRKKVQDSVVLSDEHQKKVARENTRRMLGITGPPAPKQNQIRPELDS